MPPDTGTGEKTEQATPKKLRDAREEGQVMKSNEVVMTGAMLIMFMALRSLYPSIAESLMEFSSSFLSGQRMDTFTLGAGIDIIPLMQSVFMGFLMIMLPILGIALVAGVLLNVVQVGFLFTTKALMPKMNRLNPLEGFKRMFSTRSLFELAKSIGKVAAVGIVIYITIMDDLEIFPALMHTNIHGALLLTAQLIFDAAFNILLVLGIIAVLDFFFQRRRFNKDMMMSKYEIKMEMKQQEGDPQIRGRMRQRQREMAMMRMMADVPDADVVITNPTEYAVALKYDESVGDAPVVKAKGKDLVAAKIKEVAKEAGVEIVENKPLARSLYAYCEVGQFIPMELYQVVAEILAQVYRAKGGKR